MGGDKSFMEAIRCKGIPRFMLIDQDGKFLNANMPRPSDGKTLEILNALPGLLINCVCFMNQDFLDCRNVRVLFGWKFFFLYFWVNSYDTFMITKEQVEIFVTQAHRYGEARLMLCSSGNLSWRVGDKMLVSGTGSWLPVLPPEKVAVCDIISGQVENGVRPSMESEFH